MLACVPGLRANVGRSLPASRLFCVPLRTCPAVTHSMVRYSRLSIRYILLHYYSGGVLAFQMPDWLPVFMSERQ